MDDRGGPRLDDADMNPACADVCDLPAMNDILSSLPSLILTAIWSQLSYASRRHLRATCRALRLRVDADLIETIVATGQTTATSAVQQLLPSGAACAILRPSTAATNLCSALPIATSPCTLLAEAPAGVSLNPGISLLTATTSSGNTRGRQGGAGLVAPPNDRFHSLRGLILTPYASAATPRCPRRSALPTALQPFLSPPPSSLLSPFVSCPGLTHLVLLDLVPGPSERDIATIAAAFPALALLHLLASPGCAVRSAVPPLGALRACCQLRSLGVDLGRSSVMGSAARSSLGLLTQLTHLMLGLADTGRDDLEAVCSGTGSLAHAYHHYYGCHWHRTNDGSGGSCCTRCAGQVDPHRDCGPSLQRHHQNRNPNHEQHGQHRSTLLQGERSTQLQGQVGRPQQEQQHEGQAQVQAQRQQQPQVGQQQAVAAGPVTRCAVCSGRDGLIVAAMVGGVEASLYSLTHANLCSLELRVISFGSYERRLLQAVAAGSAAAAAAAGTAKGAASVGDAAAPAHGLQRLCLRLMPAPLYMATSSAPSSFAAGGSTGLGGAFGGSGLGGDDIGPPSASLSCIPLALGNASASQHGWAQPSEAELMLAALTALPGLRAVELPEVLLASSRQLTCLTALTALSELRIGGVVAAGVPPSSVAPRERARELGPVVGTEAAGGRRRGAALPLLPWVRTLAVEAESPAYGGGGSVPWWSAMCPSLQRVSLTLQYGSGSVSGGGALGGSALGVRHDGQLAVEPLVAALAGLTEVQLVVCGAARGAAPAAPAAVASAAGTSSLRHDLCVLMRRIPGLRHLELFLEDTTQLLGCISPDLLAAPGVEERGRGPGVGALAVGHRAGGEGAAAGGCRTGGWGPAQSLRTLKLVTAAGWMVGRAATAGAAERAIKLCEVLGSMLERASPPLECLCLAVPGFAAWERWPWEGGKDGDAAGPLEPLVKAATARGTRLCLCSLGSEQRARVMLMLESRGLAVQEGRCWHDCGRELGSCTA